MLTLSNTIFRICLLTIKSSFETNVFNHINFGFSVQTSEPDFRTETCVNVCLLYRCFVAGISGYTLVLKGLMLGTAVRVEKIT